VFENISERLSAQNSSLKSVIAFSVNNVHMNFGEKSLFISYSIVIIITWPKPRFLHLQCVMKEKKVAISLKLILK
jgi:hypothetical protein